jgi:hypothetical protein
MYNHLVLEPQRSAREENINNFSKNATYLNHLSEENYMRLRNNGLDLISRGKGIIDLMQ